jgi:prepilin-type N-terminal cleavage/methylation domain-containing protein
MNRRPRSTGFTLVEVLITIAVVVVMVGILSAVLVSSRKRAGDASEISNMHQLGLAQGVYTADTGYIPMSVRPLVTGGYAPASVCVSPFDTTPDGFTNAVIAESFMDEARRKKLRLPFRSSFLGVGDMGMSYKVLNEYAKEMPGGGWLISVVDTPRGDPKRYATSYQGAYRRLLLDGSVQTRHATPITLDPTGNGDRIWNSTFLFMDGTEEWKRKITSESL